MARRANGEGTIRKRSDGRWEGRYYNPIEDKQRSIYGKTQKEVREQLSKIAVNKDVGLYTMHNDLKVKEWVDIFLRNYKDGYVKPQTLSNYRSVYKNHVIPHIGDRNVNSITETDIRKILKVESEECNITTIRHIQSGLFSLFSQAVKCKYIQTNPAADIKLPRNDNPIHKKRELNEDEIYWFIRGVYEHKQDYFLYFCLLLTTGMRKSEALALKWNDLSDDFGWLKVDATAVYYYDGEKTINGENEPKSKTSIRELPIHQCVSEGFKRQKEKAIFLAQQFDREFSDDDYIFIKNKTNQRIGHATISSCIRSVKTYLLEEYNIYLSYFSPHYLRHTFASKCMRKNVPLETLRLLMGHRDYEVLLKYAHANSNDKKMAIQVCFLIILRKLIRVKLWSTIKTDHNDN